MSFLNCFILMSVSSIARSHTLIHTLTLILTDFPSLMHTHTHARAHAHTHRFGTPVRVFSQDFSHPQKSIICFYYLPYSPIRKIYFLRQLLKVAKNSSLPIFTPNSQHVFHDDLSVLSLALFYRRPFQTPFMLQPQREIKCFDQGLK